MSMVVQCNVFPDLFVNGVWRKRTLSREVNGDAELTDWMQTAKHTNNHDDYQPQNSENMRQNVQLCSALQNHNNVHRDNTRETR